MSVLYQYGEPGNRLSNFKLCIATPAYDLITAAYCHSLMITCLELQKKGIEFYTMLFPGNCHCDDARNKLVRDFLQTDCTHLLFIDADTKFWPEDVLQLIGHDKDIVGAIYPMKEERERFVVAPLEGAETGADGLLEVKGLGTGFLKIKRCALEQLDKESVHHFDQWDGIEAVRNIPIIFERIVADNTRLSGDYAFCWKWRKAGGTIHADPTIKLGHIGTHEWTGQYSACLKRQQKKGMQAEIDLIKAGKETDHTLIDMTEIYGNVNYACTAEMLMVVLLLSRQVHGNVLECGTGLTTLTMAAANPNVNIYALEEDAIWASHIQTLLDTYEIKNAKIIHAPLKSYEGLSWYTLPDELPIFDMVVCDGPRNIRFGVEKIFKTVLNGNIRSGSYMIFDDYGTHIGEELKILGDEINVLGGIRKFAIVKRR